MPCLRNAFLVAALTALGCGGAAEPPPIRLGHVATMSGPNGDAGRQASLGIRLALMLQTDAKVTKLSRSLAVHHTDTQGDPAAFEAQAIRLTTVNRVIGLYGGETVLELQSLDAAGVPVVTPLGFRPPGASDHVFCVGLSPSAKGELTTQFLSKADDVSELTVLLDERDPTFVSTVEALTKKWRESAKSKSAIIRRYTDKPPFEDVVDAMIPKKSAAVVFVGPVADFRVFCQSMKDRSLPILFAGPEPIRSRVTSDPIFDSTLWITAFCPTTKTKDSSGFVKQFRKAFDAEPDANAALAFDGIKLTIAALRRCEDRYTAQELQKQLSELKDLDTVTGKATFDDKRRLQRVGFVVRLQNERWTILQQNIVAGKKK